VNEYFNVRGPIQGIPMQAGIQIRSGTPRYLART
jgi:hypothetical protein